MTEETRAIIKEAVSEYIEQSNHQCRFDINPALHKKQHEALGNIIATLDRINNVKWGILKGFLQAIFIAGFLALVAFLWTHGVKE